MLDDHSLDSDCNTSSYYSSRVSRVMGCQIILGCQRDLTATTLNIISCATIIYYWLYDQIASSAH